MVARNGCNSCYKEWHSLVGWIISMIKQFFFFFLGLFWRGFSVVKVECVVLCVVGEECPTIGLLFSFLKQVILLYYELHGKRCKFNVKI
jgi:hypothetical protein